VQESKKKRNSSRNGDAKGGVSEQGTGHKTKSPGGKKGPQALLKIGEKAGMRK